MEQHKTDESVKAGLQIEAGTNPVKRKRKRIPLKRNEGKEMDADETLHQQGFAASTDHDEQDIDDLLHRTPISKTISENDEQDPDDLVHEADGLEPEK